MSAQTPEQLLLETAQILRNRYFGKYRGLVSAVDDPESRGRIRAKVPNLLDEVETNWAMPCVPLAGKNYGFAVLPEVGDGVWIEFEAGNLNQPIWSGFWWADNEWPKHAGPKIRIFRTPNGHELVLDDEGDTLALRHSGGALLEMDSDKILLKIGSTKLELSALGLVVNDGALEVR